MTGRPVRHIECIVSALTEARERAARRERAKPASAAPPMDAMAFLVRVAGSVPAAATLAGVSASTVRAVVAGQQVRPVTARLIVDAACRVAADRAHRLRGPNVPKPRAGDKDEPERLTRREVVVIETEHLLAAGESPWQIARRLGLQLDSLRTALVRAGRLDLAERVLPGQARAG